MKHFIFELGKFAELHIPVTLVNEYNTTQDAKRVIVDIQQTEYPDNPDMIFRKRMYDRVAAQVILQQFVDYINNNKELLAIDI